MCDRIIPIGINNFETIVKECYYIDKTMLIKELIDYPEGSTILYTRPRRFGKSLNLSMIKTFYDIRIDSYNLFKDLKINNYSESIKEINNYPVISIAFNKILGSSFNETLSCFKDIISNLYLDFKGDIYESLNSIEQSKYDRYIKKDIEDANYVFSLNDLSNYLYKKYHKKTVILIDEYDSPIECAFSNGFYNDIFLFYKQLLTNTLKENNNLHLGLLFGVMELAKDSLFSGLNNIIVNSIVMNKDKEYFGFNENDVKEILSYYHKEECLNEIKKWYGGYLFSGTYIYNPWSVLNFIKFGFAFKPYWTNTGSNHILGDIISKNTSNFIEYLNKLVTMDSIITTIDFSLSYQDIYTRRDALFSFLVETGYLTIKDQISISIYVLQVPNNEVKELFKKEVIDRFIDNNQLVLAAKLRKAIIENNIISIKSLFENYILSSLSYYDFNNENAYQMLVLGVTSLLFDNCIVKSEVNEGLGRCDILIQSNSFGVIFEIKHLKGRTAKDRLEMSATTALNQIENKDYYEDLLKQNTKNIILYGVAFYNKTMAIKSKEINLG